LSRKALVLGASGRIGRHAATALEAHGWTVAPYRRGGMSLSEAAQGADLIFNAWNPPYSQWQATVPGLTAQVIAAARATGAVVMIPGNVYVFGRDLPEVLTPDTPHAAAHPLGRIRVEMEAAYRASGVKTVILRAGDFLDTEASGNWLDRIIAAKIGKGRLSYPGPLDRMHAWAYLPDLADAFAGLSDRLDALPTFTDLAFPGYAMTGEELSAACEAALGRSLSLGRCPGFRSRSRDPSGRRPSTFWRCATCGNRPHHAGWRGARPGAADRRQTPVAEAMRRVLAPLAG
jgi:nucleoside-diphosphate-sugar epimerase